MENESKTQSHNGKIVVESDGYSVIDCVPCGFKHVWPHPTAKALSELYNRSY